MATADTVLKPDHGAARKHFIFTDEHEQLRDDRRRRLAWRWQGCRDERDKLDEANRICEQWRQWTVATRAENEALRVRVSELEAPLRSRSGATTVTSAKPSTACTSAARPGEK